MIDEEATLIEQPFAEVLDAVKAAFVAEGVRHVDRDRHAAIARQVGALPAHRIRTWVDGELAKPDR